MDYSIIEGEQFGEIFIPADHDYGVSVWAKPLNKDLEKDKHKQKTTFRNDYVEKKLGNI
jgi:hypothetical protein